MTAHLEFGIRLQPKLAASKHVITDYCKGNRISIVQFCENVGIYICPCYKWVLHGAHMSLKTAQRIEKGTNGAIRWLWCVDQEAYEDAAKRGEVPFYARAREYDATYEKKQAKSAQEPKRRQRRKKLSDSTTEK